MKLPDGFMIDTPVGPYSPAGAIAQSGDGGERIYTVLDTGHAPDPAQRDPSENARIAAARKHFAAIGVNYGVGVPGEWGL
ncbi:hypothetical protein KRX55_05390 [Corynebacterium sp. TAE3-ERU16]|nr:hypothetical protein [Corynebacterium sp. TAE3-ERU16]